MSAGTTSRLQGAVLALLVAMLPATVWAQARGGGGGKGQSAPVDKTEELNLTVGENRTLPAADIKNYSIGAPGIVEVKVTTDGGQFVVVGQKAGSTTLLLIHHDGSRESWVINVFQRSPEAVERELRDLIDGSVGLRVRRVGTRFFIEGGVSTEADQKRIQRIASLYPGQVESLVEVGSVASDRQFNIRIDFYFVQFDKNSGYTVGLGWPGKVGGEGVFGNAATFDLVSGNFTSATATVTNQPLPSLDIASTRGWAKVLKQATIITGNGTEAKFGSGGEQNFQISTNLTTNVRPIEFGVNLTVLPRFDRAARDMEVRLAADVADLVPPIASTTLPGRNTSRLDTLVHLKLGQSIVLSGVSTKNQRHRVTGLPILSEIPVLGLLFASHEDALQDVEGAIFIIPSVIDTLPKASLDIINNEVHQYETYTGNIRKANLYDKKPPVIRP
ncbi:Type II/IV secretion system secretin RcpA/CpaC, associated with Flp pilus assembly [Labilithrix luteola]|uniref:Type II/IV secretion system secretin RcpA/CpaC, associated with Flp pilus assembly n=1 Tax=Labilithrix luteola TaxID=1391654 RepID=A0A0K1PKZ5_9BACT|nr:pilus assembly protein N-terminal domain-containing protein [Labilithrix luteola]AKU94076.1 Type II/IV secretion system secretin RcpA/CpaC, associated with Flp pilus assembly [Labilithrix luteola]